MFTIIIEKEISFEGKEIYTLEQKEKSANVKHEQEGFKKNGKTITKKISLSDFRPIEDTFLTLDFSKIFKESGNLCGCDGWTLRCTLRNVLSDVSISIWCPSKEDSKPETTKLLEACERVFSFFE